MIQTLRWRANRILEKRSAGEVDALTEAIEELIVSVRAEREEEVREEFLDQRARVLANDGGWELQYLEGGVEDPDGYPRHVDFNTARRLLENWPGWANETPDFPVLDMSGIDVLDDLTTSGYPYDDIKGCVGATEAELYAGLGSNLLNDAENRLWIEEGVITGIPWSAQTLIMVSASLVEATEAIGRAQELALREKLSEIRNVSREERKHQALEAARQRGTQARIALYAAPRRWVQERWDKEAGAYGNNKTDAARTYVDLIAQTFTTASGDPLRVTADTVRAWMRTGMSAG